MKRNTWLPALVMITGIALLGFLTPWWAPPFWVVLVTAFMKMNLKTGIVIGAISYGLVWTAMARYMSEQDAADIITKTGSLLGGLSHQMMFVAIVIVSLITGALSGWFGSVLGSGFSLRGPNHPFSLF